MTSEWFAAANTQRVDCNARRTISSLGSTCRNARISERDIEYCDRTYPSTDAAFHSTISSSSSLGALLVTSVWKNLEFIAFTSVISFMQFDLPSFKRNGFNSIQDVSGK